jgi:heme exporter protein A
LVDLFSCNLLVDGLGVERGHRTVLRDLGFTLAPGEALAVTGPNGAGKSTLLRALCGLLPLSTGRTRLEGVAADTAAGEHIHLLGHRDGVKDALSPRENLRFWRAFLEGDGDPQTVLETVRLGHAADLPASYLSAGQRRRLAIGRLLIAPRPLWLLDEPTNALDAESQERLAGLVAEHRARGGMVIAATHQDLGWPDLRRLPLGLPA